MAPSTQITNVRTIRAIAAQEGRKLYQFDVTSACFIPECKENREICTAAGRIRQLPGKVRKVLPSLNHSTSARNRNQHF